MKRIASLWLVDWPITVWRQQQRASRNARPPDQPEPPFALVTRDGNAAALAAVNAPARALGLEAGRSQAAALAMVPTLLTAPADADGDRRALRRLAHWMERYSPIAVSEWSDPLRPGLFIDISGCAHAYGSERAMLADMLARLARRAAPACVAAAATPGAAWALARHSGQTLTVIDAGGDRAVLAGLPVSALRIGAEATRLLARFGLTRIGDLGSVSRAALARRLRGAAGLDVILAHDRALGLVDEPLDPPRRLPQFRVQAVFAEPVSEVAALTVKLPALAAQLGELLAAEGRGARKLLLSAWRVDGALTAIAASFAAASHDPVHFVRVLSDRGLELLDLGFGIDAWRLSAPVTEALTARQADAFAAARQGDGVAALIDRLSAKLGAAAVQRPVLQASWLPERAERLVPYGAVDGSVDQPLLPDRPLLIFDRPEPIETVAEVPDGIPFRFTWRRVTRRVMKGSGPERLSAEWWRPARVASRPPRTRDYYKLEDEDGGRYWVFREGLYGTEDGERPPGWWLHGLFP